jgi:hypothetical protein
MNFFSDCPNFSVKKGEDGKMGVKKIVTIVVDVLAGFTVVLVGLGMLSFPLNIIWGLFNAWLWIVTPTAILWAKNKEDEKSS